MSKEKKQSFTVLYVAIAVCLIVSGVAAYGLLGRVQTYKESEKAYSYIQAQALHTAPPMGATDAPENASAAAEAIETAALDDGEPEGETVEDEAFFWMLEHQNLTWETISPRNSQNVLIASGTSGISAAGRSETGDEQPVDTHAIVPAITPSPTSEPAAEPTPELTEKPVPEPTAESTPEPAPESESTPDATEGPTPTPAPSHTEVPFYMPKDGISMERAVKLDSAKYAVDFDYLTRFNADVAGWLIQDTTDINYPVMRGEDNEHYLNHLLDGTLNKNGSLFMDCGNSLAFIDEATYVYGHNSKDGGMFALLGNYVEQSYYDEHPQMLLMTPFADYQVDLFAGIKTTVEDESSWRIKSFDGAESFDGYVKEVCAQSMFAASSDKLPVWGDKLLVLVTCTNFVHGDRYVIYGRMRPIVYGSSEGAETTKLEMDKRPTVSGYKDVGTLGKMMVYAQNDPIWDRMIYESRKLNKHRVLGDGGCGPTCAAMIIANLVPKERLPELIGYADYDLGYTFCECSVNRYYCNHLHAQYHLKTPDEFLRYLPVAIANYATGNNIWETISRSTGAGTSMRFIEKLCLIYKLRLSATRYLDEAVERLKQGNCLVLVSTNRGPYTTRGHYLVLAGVDDEYLYVLDPYIRDSYGKNYRAELVEIIEPGITRVKLENADKCFFHTMYTIERTPET